MVFMEVRGPDLVVFFGDGVAAPADTSAGNPQNSGFAAASDTGA
jgi:hypothetical protein